MKISVIIPTRNRFSYVSNLIEDLHKQDIEGFEILVIDQSDIVEPISGCEHIVTKTQGPCVSRNIGALKAKGDILVFLDDDARVLPNFISEITRPILKEQYSAVAGAICSPEGHYMRDASDFLKLKTENFIKALTNNPDSESSRICLSFPAGCSSISKKVFESVGGFNELFDPSGAGEDREMAIKLFFNGIPIWYNSQAKLLHKVAKEGGSRGQGSRSIMLDIHCYYICKTYFSDFLSNEFKHSILKKYRNNFFKSLVSFKGIRSKYSLMNDVKKLLKNFE